MALRIVLIVSSVALVIFMMGSIKRSKMRIEDSVFWILVTLLIVFLALFPAIPYFLSDVLGFQAPVNFVFLFFIFILILKSYTTSKHASQLETKVRELAQQIALDRLDHYERRDAPGRAHTLGISDNVNTADKLNITQDFASSSNRHVCEKSDRKDIS